MIYIFSHSHIKAPRVWFRNKKKEKKWCYFYLKFLSLWMCRFKSFVCVCEMKFSNLYVILMEFSIFKQHTLYKPSYSLYSMAECRSKRQVTYFYGKYVPKISINLHLYWIEYILYVYLHTLAAAPLPTKPPPSHPQNSVVQKWIS